MNTEQERAEFEAWYRKAFAEDVSCSTFIYYESCNQYQRPYVDRMWAAYQAGRAALQSQDLDDAERLDWLLRHLPGDAIRYCVGVIADTADIDEFRAAIDHARRVEGDGE